MALSDEEGETVPDCVSNYCMVDNEGKPTSFSSLPLRWNDDEGERLVVPAPTGFAFLRGSVGDGCGQIHKKIIAWKFILSYVIPEIYVQDSKYERWIKLHKPKKNYESYVRTVLISVYCLHFMKKNCTSTVEELWKHIRKTFR